jgi:hypothetical protein
MNIKYILAAIFFACNPIANAADKTPANPQSKDPTKIAPRMKKTF